MMTERQFKELKVGDLVRCDELDAGHVLLGTVLDVGPMDGHFHNGKWVVKVQWMPVDGAHFSVLHSYSLFVNFNISKVA